MSKDGYEHMLHLLNRKTRKKREKNKISLGKQVSQRDPPWQHGPCVCFCAEQLFAKPWRDPRPICVNTDGESWDAWEMESFQIQVNLDELLFCGLWPVNSESHAGWDITFLLWLQVQQSTVCSSVPKAKSLAICFNLIFFFFFFSSHNSSFLKSLIVTSGLLPDSLLASLLPLFCNLCL